VGLTVENEDFLECIGGNMMFFLGAPPGYSPALNPDEGRQYMKCVCLKNVCCHDMNELKKHVKKARRTVRSP